ncbi:hypothetical protein CH063_12205 [Colletotrichum higginsianum]|uniref:Uncharacterized protein n=1 Tax=Colletotrichum higginsianum (strain IMI 349063) TaxID=759273 RepID=H1VPH0_COLHI|nr:hypothetical protein CH063_12205 [Colletotrichum higginsianum]
MCRFFEQILVVGIVIVSQIIAVVINLGHIEQGQIRFLFRSQVVFDVAIIKYDDAAFSRLAGALLDNGLKGKATKDITQVPRTMRVHDPNFNTTKCQLFPLWFQSQQTSQVDHATDTKANNHSSAASLGLHHGLNQVPAGAIEVGISGDRLDLMGNIVVLQ